MFTRFSKIAVTVAAGAILLSVSQFCWAAEGAKNLQDYVKIAVEKSPNIRLANIAFERTQLTQTDNRLKGSVLAAKQADIAMKSAQRAQAAAQRDAILAVQTGYYTLLKAQKGLEIAIQSAKQASEQLQMIKVRYDQGMATKLELISAEKAARSADISVIKAKNDRTQAENSFKRSVGITEDIVLVDDTPTNVVVELALEDAVKMAQTGSSDLEAAQEQLELAQMQYNLSQNDFTPANTKKLNQIALEEAQINLEQKKADIVTTATNYYISYLDTINQIELAKKTMEYAVENSRITKLRYDAGLESAMTLIQSQISLDSANVDNLNAYSNYNMAKTKLFSYINYTTK